MSKIVKSNTVIAGIEFFFDALITFLVYRYIIKNLGVSTLGIWSLAMSLTVLTSVGSSGFASSAVKFVAKYFAHKDIENVKKVILTTAITVFLFAAIFVLITRLLLGEFYRLLFSNAEYLQLQGIINVVFLSFIVNSVARVFLSSLDGLNLIYLRGRIGIVCKFSYGVLNLVLVPIYGLVGLAIAQLSLGVMLAVLSAFVLMRRINPESQFAGWRFDKKIFREIFYYGTNFQLTSILQMFTDPMLRFFLKDMGGLHSVGLFELIYKVFSQIRQFIVVIMNTRVPVIARQHEVNGSFLKTSFLKLFSQTMVISLVGMSVIFPFLSVIFRFFEINELGTATNFSILISIALYLNLLAATSFIFNLGIGNIQMNTASAFIFVIVNLSMSYLLGKLLGDVGVLLGWTLAHIVSSVFLLSMFFKKHSIKISELINWREVGVHLILAITLIALLVSQKIVSVELSWLPGIFLYLIFLLLFTKLSFKPKELIVLAKQFR